MNKQEDTSKKDTPHVNRQLPLTGTGNTENQSANPWIPIDKTRPQWYMGCDIICTDGTPHLNWARVTSDGSIEYFCNNRDDRIIFADEVLLWRLTEFGKMYGNTPDGDSNTENQSATLKQIWYYFVLSVILCILYYY